VKTNNVPAAPSMGGVQRERFRRIRRLYWHGKRETRTAAAEKTQKRETRNVDRRLVRARVRAVTAVVKAARDRPTAVFGIYLYTALPSTYDDGDDDDDDDDDDNND